MKKKLLRRIEKLNKNRRQRQWWQRAVRMMAGIVVFCTTYALILPAITMGEDPVCGQEEHVHSDSCYTLQPVMALQCPVDGSVLTVHSHDALCFDAQGVLRCTLPEISEHTHGEACYGQDLICTEEHVCSEDCVATEQVLVCTEPEGEDHAHGDSCYETREIPCPLVHIHGESCYARSELPTCGRQEVETHIHEENCYAADGTLNCTKPVVYRHIHTESCLVPSEETLSVLSCGMAEHIHSEECYPVETEEDRSGYFCGSGEHTHVETCFDEAGALICTIPEHRHTPICQVEVDLSADTETAPQWEAAFQGLTLTHNWPEDLLAVAETQLRYSESEKNVIQTEEGLLKGYTRYGAWYGDPYGDWNTMFTAFCLHYAGVEGLPVAPDHDRWMAELTQKEQYLPADQYIPKPGDLVFIDWDQQRLPDGSVAEIPVDADQVGILVELMAPTQEEPAKIRIIAGDAEDRVDYVSYDLEDPAILGYGILPEAPEGHYICGLTGHSHCWLCADGLCGRTEHIHTAACESFTLTYADEVMQAVMTVNGFGDIPEDLSMNILPVTAESDTNAYGAMVSAVGETMADSAYYVNDAVFYRVELMSDGAVYTLPEDVQTSIQVTMLQPAFGPEAMGESSQLRSYTLVEEISVEIQEDVQTDIPRLLAVMADAMAETVQPTMPAAEEVEEAAPVNYQAVALAASAAPEDQLSFTTENSTVFGVALADVSTVTGYWKRVTSTAELTSDGTYLIVSTEGNYALGYNNAGTKVYIDSIKANEDYYHITTTNATDGATINLPAAHWNFSGSGNSFTVRNATYNNYYLEVSAYYAARQLSNYYYDYDGMDALTLTYQAQEGAWTFYDDGYYLINNNTANFGVSKGTSHSNIRSRSMLIFKLVNDSLAVPDDVVTIPDAGVGSEIPDKPTYPGYVDVSGSKTGQTSHVVDEEAGTSIAGSYYSDPATSKLEDHFDGSTEEDGMVHSDKSVIYGDDNYDAFQTYAPNTFGVTLSALGQEFISGDQDYIKTPVDVMFVLDISGSMNAEKVPGSSTTTRSMAMVEAVNKTIAEIMDRNPDNRVGAVLYSSGTGNLLELGRYTEANDNFLEMRQGSWTSSSGTFSGSFIYPNDTLYREDGTLYQDSGTYAYQFNGTYTQAGIALGAQKLMAVQDITTDVTAFEGTENETTIRVRRQPVIILLSDGEPTHSTSNYKDVLAGPHYGDGLASSADYRGVHGYYTILSANYYKRMVGIHYHQSAQFYSVGMGINPTGATPASSSDDAYYKRAVLDPTAARVQEAYNSSTYNAANTSRQLYQLLNNTYLYNTVTVTADNQGYMPPWIGQVHAAVPVIKNPYLGDYSYADGAYFGNYNAQQLADAFGEILDATETVSPYGFVLRSRTSMRMDDPIGEGMEVKGSPVLRYGGINYYVSSTEVSVDGRTVTYHYDGFYEDNDGSGHTADLSKVTVQVITDANGLQTVHMDIPDYILPAYAPYTQGFKSDGTPYFYYEDLPIRLIYQVGLTEESEAQLDDLYDYGGSAVYYTNRYESDTIAKSKLLPTADNPYYMEHASTGQHENCHHTDKAENTTGTITTSFECHHALVPHGNEVVPEVTQKLGNNGKLVFTAERKVIDIPVEKHWQNAALAAQYESIELKLYSVVNETVTYVDSLMVGSSNDWKGVFDRLPLLPEDGFYFLTEEISPGLAADYSGEKVSVIIDGKNIWGVKISGQDPVVTEIVLVTNSVGYALPETGGTGTYLFTFGGWLMIAAACVYFVIQIERKYRKGGVYRQE